MSFLKINKLIKHRENKEITPWNVTSMFPASASIWDLSELSLHFSALNWTTLCPFARFGRHVTALHVFISTLCVWPHTKKSFAHGACWSVRFTHQCSYITAHTCWNHHHHPQTIPLTHTHLHALMAPPCLENCIPSWDKPALLRLSRPLATSTLHYALQEATLSTL